VVFMTGVILVLAFFSRKHDKTERSRIDHQTSPISGIA